MLTTFFAVHGHVAASWNVMKSYRYEVCTFTAAKEDAFCLFREKFKLDFLKKRIAGLKVLVSASVECCYLFCMLKAGNLKYEVTNSLACLVINLLRLLGAVLPFVKKLWGYISSSTVKPM